MGYVLVFLNITCCILYAASAITATSTTRMIASIVCSILWGACAVLNTFTYIIK